MTTKKDPGMILFIPKNELVIGTNRQRKIFDETTITNLAQSFREVGVIHPITIRTEKTPEGKITKHLVAGESRIKALDWLYALDEQVKFCGNPIPIGSYPCNDLGFVDEIEAEAAELAENIYRKDLSWQEECAATERLMSLRVAQNKTKGQNFTIQDLATELHNRTDGGFSASIKRTLDLASVLDTNPEVAKAASKKEAIKILERQDTAQRREQLAISVGETFNAGVHTALNTNCIDWMTNCNAGIFDVILTDAPYGMGADTFGDGGGKLTEATHVYDDSYSAWVDLMRSWCSLSFKVAKPEAHAYVFCDQENYQELKYMMQTAGWYVFRTMLIAHKINSGRVPLPDMGPRRQYETILFAIKGKKKVNYIGSDVLESIGDENMGHGAQKPVMLFSELLRRSTKPGDTVLDSFAGSGTIFPAAHGLQVIATGIELSKNYFGMCLERLEELGKKK